MKITDRTVLASLCGGVFALTATFAKGSGVDLELDDGDADAMGNGLRPNGVCELGAVPYFVLAEGVSAEKIAAVVRAALEEK